MCIKLICVIKSNLSEWKGKRYCFQFSVLLFCFIIKKNVFELATNSQQNHAQAA